MTSRALIILLLFPLWVSAQQADFRFYTTADGLSGNHIQGMEQDKRGFLWVLNARKLHRFDGRNFVVYPPPTDTSGSKIELIFLDPYHDSLLLLLSPSHLYLFEPKAGEWQSFPTPARKGRKAVSMVLAM